MNNRYKRALSLLLAAALLFSLAACGSKRTTKETESVVLGIDVAKYQGTIDWQALAGAGVKFAMVRLGYRTAEDGVIVEDSNARYNLQEGARAGIPMGAYFFSTAISEEEAKEEAHWVADLVAKYPITYPIVYDCEGFLDNRQKDLSGSERTDIALAFLKEIKRLGYEPMFYGSKSELENSWDMGPIEKHYKVWVAQYPDAPYPETPMSSYQGKHAMWQFSKSARVVGLEQSVDMNLAYFAYDGIEPPKDSEPPEEAFPDPEALMRFTECQETVTAKEKTNLRSIPDQGEDSQILYTLLNGETALRTATSDSGWSRLEYNGTVCYAVTSYLTTVNLRTLPSTENEESQVLTLLKHGETVKRTGVSSNGWSRLEYNGTVCYAVTSYLEAPDGTGLEPDTGEIKTQFEAADDWVTPKEKVNLRSIPSVDDPRSQVIATITSADKVHRTGLNRDVGWSRVEYNGQTLYCVTQYLNEAKD